MSRIVRTPSDTVSLFFFFNDTATTEIYTLSLHDALPISPAAVTVSMRSVAVCTMGAERPGETNSSCGPCHTDRKSTRLNSSHLVISYAVFCLKKKKQTGRSFQLEILVSCRSYQ